MKEALNPYICKNFVEGRDKVRFKSKPLEREKYIKIRQGQI